MILSSHGRKPSCPLRRWEEIRDRGRSLGEGTRTSVLRLKGTSQSAVRQSDHRRQACTPQRPCPEDVPGGLSICGSNESPGPAVGPGPTREEPRTHARRAPRWSQTAWAGPPGALLERQTLRPAPDMLIQDPQFNEILQVVRVLVKV